MTKKMDSRIILLMLALLVTGVTGCTGWGQPSRPQGEVRPVSLTLWHQWTTDGDSGTSTLDTVVSRWNQQEPKVQLHPLAVEVEQYKTRIRMALASGEAPDIFFMWGGSFAEPYARAGRLLPLDRYMQETVVRDILPQYMNAVRFEGRLYCLPTLSFVANLCCNQTLFDKAGATIPETFDELLAAVKKLRQAGITPVAVGEKDRWPGTYWFDILAMREAGLQKSRNALHFPQIFAEPSFRRAADKLLQLRQAGAFNENAMSIGYYEMLDMFTKERAAMIYQGNWINMGIQNATDPTLAKRIRIVPFPSVQGGAGDTDEFLGGNVDNFCVSSDTKHPEEAVHALTYISRTISRLASDNSAGLPCWKNEKGSESPQSALNEQVIRLRGADSASLEWWDTVLNVDDAETHHNLVAELFSGKISPEEFTTEMTRLNGAQ